MPRSLSHPSQHDSDETHRRWCHRPPRHQRGRHHRPLPPDPSAVVALVELVGLDARGGGRPDRAQRLQRREERRRLHRRLDCRGPGHRLGFVVSGDGLVVTNHHVIEGASDVTVKIGTNGKQRAAQIVADDPSHDLALLKVDTGGASLQKLSLGDSSKVDVGDATYAIGNPFGLDHTFTTGVVSALHRDLQAPNGATITGGIQTDAAINPGNSGGPLLDSAGQVIGVNAQIATGSQTGEGANVGIGFAIPSSTVKQFLSDAKAGKEGKRSCKGEHKGSGDHTGPAGPTWARTSAPGTAQPASPRRPSAMAMTGLAHCGTWSSAMCETMRPASMCSSSSGWGRCPASGSPSALLS